MKWARDAGLLYLKAKQHCVLFGRKRCMVLSCVALSIPAFSNIARAEDSSALLEEIKMLKQRVEALERKLQTNEIRAKPAITNSVSTETKSQPTVVLDANGVAFQTAGSNFVLRVHGYMQADGRFYLDGKSSTTHNTFLMRRANPIIEGTVFEKYDYRLMLDFGHGNIDTPSNQGLLHDAYLNARLFPHFQIRAGKFIPPVGLERLQSSSHLMMVERGFPTQLVPNRDTGIEVHGDLFKRTISYGLGVFNGAPDGGSIDFDFNDSGKDVDGRLFAHPLKNVELEPLQGLGIGLAATYGNQRGTPRSYVSPGQQTIFTYYSGSGTNESNPNVTMDGARWRLAPQAYYYNGPFGLLAEYTISSQELQRDAGGPAQFKEIHNKAWQLVGSWFLTGEENSYRATTEPKNSFSMPGNGPGGWELVARVMQIEFDPDSFSLFSNPGISVRRATAWGIGINWYLNKNVKLTTDYEQTTFDGTAETEPGVDGEKIIFSRAQISF